MQRRENHGQQFQMHHHTIADSKTQQPSQQQPPKALRFVTNYGAPHPKRRRIGAACLTCRKRKTACSGERPFCKTCKQNRLDCAGYSSETQGTGSKQRTPEPSSPGLPAPHRDETVKRQRLSPALDDAATTAAASKNDAAQRQSNKTWSPSHFSYPKVEPKPQDANADTSSQGSLFSGPRNRMPYFRWLGPTAIMPGFKQMVVKVKRQDASDRGRSSTNGDSIKSPSLSTLQAADARGPSAFSSAPPAADTEQRAPINLPFYDTSPMPPSELITSLANTFFVHLGCNYPFLQRERFLHDLEQKKVDAILVDAVCALAARFSTHPLLTQLVSDGESNASPAEYGHAFAQRAKLALIDTFPCPTVAAAQAALLLAYNEFGEQKDSGLWMYLGIAIRLAQDLGMHKLEGLRYIGRSGPTPKIVKHQARRGSNFDASTRFSSHPPENTSSSSGEGETAEAHDGIDEQKAVERERVDTFWAIFFLDRVVSSGTGRRSTLRDKDIELSFPSDVDSSHEQWPAPFPALIRIVHLYGRVADLLNSIKEPSDINAETPRHLANMERQVTDFYQGLSSRLHFDAVNFQHYIKAGEGTNFVLLHFWFHTLIILLHQPTLLKTIEGPMLRLFPNSQQLAMSSAKTIADILSYSQLVDAKASLGNPFTTQPIYIAACAFLKESAEQTASSSAHSRANSPTREKDSNFDGASSANNTLSHANRKVSVSALASTNAASPYAKRMSVYGNDHKSSLSKHTLLATAASQHYQLCYKALQSLETYWAGTKYILTILDQKFDGVRDPLLYTTEEAESSMEVPKPEPAFTSPGWRRQHSWGPPIVAASIENMPSPFWKAKGLNSAPESPRGGAPSNSIGYTLTGTMDSPSTHLAWHYSSGNQTSPGPEPHPGPSVQRDLSARNVQALDTQYTGNPAPKMANRPAAVASDIVPPSSNVSNFSASHPGVQPIQRDTSLALNQPFDSNVAPGMIPGHFQHQQQHHHQQQHQMPSRPYDFARHSEVMPAAQPSMHQPPYGHMPGQNLMQMNFFPADMMIESQDVDMSMLGLDMMPWFDSYPGQDMYSLFDASNNPSGDGSGMHPE